MSSITQSQILLSSLLAFAAPFAFAAKPALEITVQRYQSSGASAREPAVLEQWVYRPLTLNHCEVKAIKGSTVTSTYSYSGRHCATIDGLASECQSTSFAKALASEGGADQQTFRMRLAPKSSWYKVSPVAPQSCSISVAGELEHCTKEVLSPPQQLLLNIQLMGSGEIDRPVR